jgi:hypothetical protein
MSWVEKALAHERAARECDRAVALAHACANLRPVEELELRRLIDMAVQSEGGAVRDSEPLAGFTRAEREWPEVRATLIRLGKILVADGEIFVPFVERGLR